MRNLQLDGLDRIRGAASQLFDYSQHASAIARYANMREATYQFAAEVLRPLTGVTGLRITAIDYLALAAWRDTWMPDPKGDGGFDWFTECQRTRHKVARLDLALWSGGMLCGLAVGRPSPAKRFMRVHLLEGNPDKGHPLYGMIAECVVETFSIYGRLLDAQELRIIAPLPRALRSYRRIGFRLPKGFTFGPDPNAVDAGLRPPYCVIPLQEAVP